LSYSGFCSVFHNWKKGTEISLSRNYKAGEYLFLDYAGMTVPIYKEFTDEILFQAQIFVCALGASNYIYAEATASQELKYWLGSQERAFEYYGGVPEIVVPDNLKSAVTAPCRYEPYVNKTYADFAEHYNIAVIPARSKKPRDKGKVENGVQNVERWILAPLRNSRFYAIDKLNVAIRPLLEALNHKMQKDYGVSRYELFLETDKPALKPLPLFRFKLSTWKNAKVNIDYHVEVFKNYYSIPFRFIGKIVGIRTTEDIVDVLLEGKIIAKHALCKDGRHRFITNPEHMPEAHKSVTQNSHAKFIKQAQAIGENTLAQVKAILQSRKHLEQSYRSILGILRLGDKYGNERLENACKKANDVGAASYKSISLMLKNNSEMLKMEDSPVSTVFVSHSNIRGKDYFH